MSATNYRSLNAASIDGVTAPSNSIKNAFASENVNGWATYANTAQSTPVTGTGGSPTITLTQNTINPLRFASDFLITKGAANDQGQGVSYDFFLDKADLNRQINISFDYKVSSNFVTGTNSDVQVFVYDTIGAVLIPLFNDNSNQILTNSGTFSGSFQSSGEQFYRLIFHIATTNASAYTFEFDNVQVNSAQVLPQGAVVTDWQSYTPVFTNFGTVTNINFSYRRVGSNLEIDGDFINGTGSASAASISLPPGLLSSSTLSPYQLVGTFASNLSIVTSNTSMIIAPSTSVLNIGFSNNSGGDLTPFHGDGYSSGTTFSIQASIPITGWTSGVASTSSNNFLISQFLVNGTQVTGSDPTALGQYRALYRATSGLNTLTDCSPIAIPPSSTNGIFIDGSIGATSTGSVTNPQAYVIFIGYNKTFNVEWFATTGRTGALSIDLSQYQSSGTSGAGVAYDPKLGTLCINASLFYSGTEINRQLGFGIDDSPTVVNTGYFDVQVADNQFQIQVPSPFQFFASSQVTTVSTTLLGTSFVTFSNSPAFTFTPSVSGIYKIYSALPIFETTPGVTGIGRIFNTSGGAILLYESQGQTYYGATAGTGAISSAFVQSVYTLSAGTSYQFDIQGKNSSTGSMSIDGTDSPFYMFAERVG